MFLSGARGLVWLVARGRGWAVLCVAAAALALADGASAASGPPVLTFSPSPYDFGSVPLGKTVAQTFTLTNTGGAPAAPVITLEGSSTFAIAATSDMCTATVLEPGDSCTVEVQFAPTATSAGTATLIATSKKPAATATDSLSATVTTPSLAGETLKVTNGPSSTLTGTCSPGESVIFSFSVSGTAAGPFPGTFKESGSFVLSVFGRVPRSGFTSTFTITSGSITITGTNSETGASGLTALCTPPPSDAPPQSRTPFITASVQAATFIDSVGAGAATIAIVGYPPGTIGPNFSETFSAGLGGPPPPPSKNQCVHGGWKDFGTKFKNQGDCVAFFATHGKNRPAGHRLRKTRPAATGLRAAPGVADASG